MYWFDHLWWKNGYEDSGKEPYIKGHVFEKFSRNICDKKKKKKSFCISNVIVVWIEPFEFMDLPINSNLLINP